LISPIDTLSDQVFFIHMIQHVLLLDIVPIFMILGLSKVIMRPIARTVLDLERGLGFIAHPVFAVIAYAGLMVVWHIPALYDAALEQDTVHVLEHVTFASIGWLYWWHLLGPVRSHSMSAFGPVIYMVSTKLVVGALGVAITFSRHPLYSFYERGEEVWGIPPLGDQSVAGALMALEQSIVMGTALAFLFVRALSESERQDQREDAEADRLELAAQDRAIGDVPVTGDRDVALDPHTGAEADVPVNR
jgi:cytochrome c oxidase assembly factor CtaG